LRKGIGYGFDGKAAFFGLTLRSWMLGPGFLLLIRSLIELLTGAPLSSIAATVSPVRGRAMADLSWSLAAPTGSGFFNLVGLFRVFEFEEVGYIEEGVALQAHVHKGGLHAGQNAGDAAVVNRPRQRVLVFAFVVYFRELIVFKNCKPRLMRRGGDADFLCHRTFPSSGVCLLGTTARWDGERRDRKKRG